MIVWRELTIIDYHAPFDQGLRSNASILVNGEVCFLLCELLFMFTTYLPAVIRVVTMMR